jgi:choline-glycine betaine transporter
MSDSEKGIGNGISLNAARKRGLRPGVILIPVLIFATLVVLGFLNASAFTGFLWDVFLKIMVNFGWLIDLGCLGFVLFMLIMIVTPIGSIKFGGKHAKPEYSRWNWWAISLCAGIGTGIVLWGPVEPLWLAMEPAKGTGLVPGSQGAVLWAMEKSFLHMGLHPLRHLRRRCGGCGLCIFQHE